MAKHKVILPALGMAQSTGVIVEWLKQVGEQVEKDEPIMALETDKAVMEVPSPASGTVLEFLAETSVPIEVGAVVAYIGDEEEAASTQEVQEAQPSRPLADSPAPQSADEACNQDAAAPFRPQAPAKATPAKRIPPRSSEASAAKVLASPKAKVLVGQAGLSIQDLRRHPQLSEPFQSEDVAVFFDWNAQKPASQQLAGLQVQARIPVQKFLETAVWLFEDSDGQIGELQLWLCIQSVLLKEFAQVLGLSDSSAAEPSVSCNLSMLNENLHLQQYSVADIFSYNLRQELSGETRDDAAVGLFFSQSNFIRSWFRPRSELLAFSLCLDKSGETADFQANIATRNICEQAVLDFLRVLLQVLNNPVPYLL